MTSFKQLNLDDFKAMTEGKVYSLYRKRYDEKKWGYKSLWWVHSGIETLFKLTVGSGNPLSSYSEEYLPRGFLIKLTPHHQDTDDTCNNW